MVPPDAASVAEYATPNCPLGNDVVVIVSVLAVVVSVRAALALCTGLLESVTLKLSEAPETAAVGVPVMAPVAAFRDSPAGNAPLVSDQV